MIGLIGFILGVVVSSVVWFFVWRNNQKKFELQLRELDKKIRKR